MREYIITVTGAAVLSAFAGFMSPAGWEKYIRLVTGMVVLCCICAPVASLAGTDFDIPDFKTDTEYNESLNTELVLEELTKSVEDDISARMKKEYGLNVSAEAVIEVNDDGEIEGVRKIIVSGDTMTSAAKERLREVYGVDVIYEK